MTTRVIVYHRSYGCDTGCCGHVVEVDGEPVGEFEFSHPALVGTAEERELVARSYAEELVEDVLGREHVADLDWDNCLVLDD